MLSLSVPLLVSWLSSSAPVPCTVELKGIPVSQLRYHELRVADRVRRAAAKLRIELVGDPTVVLTGPRYRGTWIVSPAACATGTVTLNARPRPAIVVFHCPPDDAVVRCHGCGTEIDSRVFMPEAFPAITMSGFRREVEFELKAADHRKRRIRAVIHPGRNEVRAKMTRI